ncbi:hypothetical protein DC522_29885 [Microvirga sp. KLBC 81]|uniref:hypothetical protein n=1 Tax=Microvirga sp. KLBC 81 TaxID=1862707 RepID=UPI000D50FDB7|nr:hypothetical protein [Microvirga sp. KLBC 81]PVE20858.1 hypothetical protein DC522_29885 [Microvirga sp. KLBC 81]
MSHIRRIYLCNVGQATSWRPPQIQKIFKPEIGLEPFTIMELENGGGKTTDISLGLATFEPSLRRFLPAIAKEDSDGGQARYFSDYFSEDGLPGMVAMEFIVPSTATADRIVIVGYVVTRREAEGKGQFRRDFFVIEPLPDLVTADVLATLPGSGEEGAYPELRSHRDIQAWIKHMRGRGDIVFDHEDRQDRWQKMAASHGIDLRLLGMLVDVNRRESNGDMGFFSYRTEREFLTALTGSLFEEDELASHYEHFSQGIAKIRSMEPRQAAMEQLTVLHDNASRFSRAAREYNSAMKQREDSTVSMGRIVARMRATEFELDGQIQQGLQTIDHLTLERENASERYEEMQGQGEGSWSTFYKLTCADAAERHERAIGAVTTVKREIAALGLVRLLAREAKTAEDLRDVRNKLQEQEEGLRPFIESEARARGVLIAILCRRKVSLQDQRQAADSERQNANAEMEQSRNASRALVKRRQDLEGQKVRSESDVAEAERARSERIADGHLQESETATGAIKRIQAEEEAARIALSEWSGAIVREREAIASLENVSGELHAKIEEARQRKTQIQEALRGEEHLRAQCNMSEEVTRFLEGPVDPGLPRLQETLRERAEDLQREILAGEIVLRRKEDMAKAVEAYGVAFDRPDAQRILEALHRAGLREAKAGGFWLSQTVLDPTKARAIVDADPLRLDIVVPTAADLAKATAILERETPDILSHVAISVARDVVPDQDPERIIVGPQDDAAWVRSSAVRLAEDTATERQRLSAEGNRLRIEAEAFVRIGALVETWMRTYGPRWVDDQRAALDAAETRIEHLTGEADQVRQEIAQRTQTVGELQDAVREYERKTEDRRQALKHLLRLRDIEAKAATARERLAEIYAEISGIKEQLEVVEHRIAEWAAIERTAFERSVKLGVSLKEIDAKLVRLGDAATPAEVPDLAVEDAEASWVRQKEDLDRKRSGIDPGLTVRESSLVENLEAIQSEIADFCNREGITRQDGMRFLPEAHVLDDLTERARKRLASHDAEVRAAFRALHEVETAHDKFRQERKISRYPDLPYENPEDAQVAAQAFGAEAAAQLRRREAIDEKEKAVALLISDLRTQRTRVKDWSDNLPAGFAHILPDGHAIADLGAEMKHFKEMVEHRDRAIEAARKWKEDATEISQSILKQVTSDTFKSVDPMVAENIRTSSLEALLQSGDELEGLVFDRIASIKDDVENLHRQIDLLTDLLKRFVGQGFRMLRDVMNVRIPDDSPVQPGKAIVRFRTGVVDIPQEARDRVMATVILEMARDQRTPRDGAHLLVDLMLKLTGSDMGTQVLKPTLVDGQYDPYNKMTHSGGEKMSVGMMFFAGIARLRAKALRKPMRRCAVLILDNPLGALTSPDLWRSTLSVLKAMDVQIIAYTGVIDHNVHEMFPYHVVMGRFRTPDGSEIHVRPVDYQRKPLPEAA